MNKMQPEPVLEDDYLKPVELVDVFVANVMDKKKTSQIVKELAMIAPLTDLQHLKRVRISSDKGGSLQIVLYKKPPIEIHKNNAEASPYEDLHKVISCIDGIGNIYLVKVPSSPPLTRHQYNEAIKYWPVNFHEDKQISSLLSGKYFTDEELKDIERYMKMAVELALIAKRNNQQPIGAVIVDPVNKKVIAEAYDLRQAGYSLQHAVMVAVDLVAHSQGGGMWQFKDRECGLKYSQHHTSETINDKNGPYLCTGYDLFITQEPCTMCSMALVHSRIGRVFYGSSHPAGALGTHYKIHCQQGLNHHYKVFKNCLSLETDKLYQHS